MATLPETELTYPLHLVHQDRPDFVLHMPEREIGIELTEAVPENHVRKSLLRQRGLGPNVHLLQRHLPGESRRSTAMLEDEIINDIASGPWVGNEVEVEWANVMLHCSEAKVVAINKPGFVNHHENWLLIYDNWPLPGVHHEEAASIFETLCKPEGILRIFNRIFVLDSKCLCEIGSGIKIHTVEDPSAGA